VGGRHTDVDDADRPPGWRRQTVWIELRKRMTVRGWLPGMWRHDAAAATKAVPGLIVVDYVEAVEPKRVACRAQSAPAPCKPCRPGPRADPDAHAQRAAAAMCSTRCASRPQRRGRVLSMPAESSDVADAALTCPRVIARPCVERKWYAICNNPRSGEVPRARLALGGSRHVVKRRGRCIDWPGRAHQPRSHS
jgi:hypothetical protein